MSRGLLFLSALLLAGCGSKPKTVTRHTAPPADPWVLACLDPSVDNPSILWNGQVGLRIARDGTGSGSMFLIDNYKTTGDERIDPVKNPLAGRWTAGSDGAPLDPREGSDYRQTLDMKTGVLTTVWNQKIDDENLRVECETVLHPTSRVAAQRWKISSDRYISIVFRNPLVQPQAQKSPGLAVIERNEIGEDNRPHSPNAKEVPEFTPGNLHNAADKDKPCTFGRIIEIGESPLALSMQLCRNPDRPPAIRKGEMNGRSKSVDEVFKETAEIWQKRWQTDIEIDGPVEDQQAVRSFLFYLRSAIDPNAGMSVSPMGLSHDHYNGHVFWDADTYVFPALALIDPEEAKAIPSYRISLEPAAARNFQEWLEGGRPTAAGRMGVPPMAGEAFGYKFPWESSISGTEAAPKTSRSRFEEHIGGDVAWMLEQAACLGLTRADIAKSIVDGVADYYRFRSVPGPDGRVMPRVMSPDEAHTGDDDLYTNLLAQWCQNGGSWDLSRDHGIRYHLPRDKTSFLNYDDDPELGYRQIAAELSIYPLQYPDAEKEAKTIMERFSGKIADYGPAMSDSIDALIWARLGETDRAYRTWQESWRDFVKEPQLQFSEKRSRPITYFTTGAAGCLQTVLYGFLGFRIDFKKQVGAVWSTDLALGRILSVRPNLPSSWKSVKLKNFTVLGRRYTLIASHPDQNQAGGVQVIQGAK
ncbi:MAG TPA: hypothetical protein VHE55_18640 [Fimbriimonadaceae bacterium]|nr:hypothetical protein [Fimbriimonadaceae bacterium]